ncbi:oligosaccharide repeat unit polymerase, partial [Escherichia coli]
LVLFRIRSFNLVKILFFAFMLLIGAALGAFYHGAEFDKTFALLLNMFLWSVIFSYAKELEHNFHIYRFSVKISSLFLGIALILYIMAKLGFHVKVFGG